LHIIMRFAFATAVFVFGVGPLAACNNGRKPEPQGAPSATPDPKPIATAPAAPASENLAGDASGVLSLTWKAVDAAKENVAVSIVAGDETISVGQLSAATDDAPGTVATCGMRNKGATASMFSCGGTPNYNFYTAKLTGGALVVTLTTGIAQEPSSEKVKEVLRRSTNATSLKATGPASPALYGNCPVGWVQKAADAVCMRQCLKGTECKGKDTCQLVDVMGSDGDHRVRACVPAGK
jgi:hypothetical protein